MKKLLPSQADNNYDFNKVIIYIFALLTAVTVGRSLVHVFALDGGANSIASMIVFTGTPDPNAVVYNLFALWGLSQLIMGLMYVIVLIKYKNLILKRTREAEPTSWFRFRGRARGRKNPYPAPWGGMGHLWPGSRACPGV